MKIGMVGPYPPPFGGISVHVKRLKHLLEQQGHDVTVDSKHTEAVAPGVRRVALGRKWYLTQLLNREWDVIHFHTFEADLVSIRRFALLARARVPIVVTMHSFRNEPVLRALKSRVSLPPALRSFRQILAVGPEVKESLMRWGAPEESLRLVSPYLPPVPNDRDRRDIPVAVDEFLRAHSPIVSANAHNLAFFEGEDLYGLDMCVELCSELVGDYPNVGFVFILGQIRDRVYYRKIVQRIGERGLGENFLLHVGATEYWPVLERSDVMVRPTNTDSFGISVAEALDLGTPVVASNVCARPEGAVLFRKRDLADLTGKVRQIIRELTDRPRTARGSDPSGILRVITDAYRVAKS